MSEETVVEKPVRTVSRSVHAIRGLWPHESALHPAWQAFLHLCAEMQHGEIERLKIQDGLPVLAEVVTRKIKF